MKQTAYFIIFILSVFSFSIKSSIAVELDTNSSETLSSNYAIQQTSKSDKALFQLNKGRDLMGHAEASGFELSPLRFSSKWQSLSAGRAGLSADQAGRQHPLIGNISIVSLSKYDFLKGRGEQRGKFALPDIPSDVSDAAQIGAAFLTNLAIHELGHVVVADYADASGSRVNFFKDQGDSFFLGTTYVDEIDERSRLPYTMGGEVAVDMTFEHALKEYREKPSTYNESLLIFSGTDFLWYCLYAFYLSNDSSNQMYDPVTISRETGLSHDALFSIAFAKTILNAYRVYSSTDSVVPVFTADRYSASLKLLIPF